MKRAFIFPGQGSQAVGMGKSFFENFACAREVFQEVDDAISRKLSKLIFEGPEEELTLTENAQVAIMATSMAIFRVLEKEAGVKLKERARMVAGHSLGEYSALCAAGAIPLADTARLLQLRGRSMQEAVPVGMGTMAAILGLEIEAVEAIAAEASAGGEVCEVANDNAPGQIVISGARGAVEAAIALAKERGAKRAIELNVSAPFHCSLIAPAADKMRQALIATAMRAPALPLIANVTAEEALDPDVIRDLLVRQVTGRVRWRESVERMAACGIQETWEIGAGKVLSGLVKRIAREINTVTVGEPADIEAMLKG